MKQILTVLLIGFLATTPLLAADSASPASASPKPEVKPLPPAVSDFVPIFDGKTLNGWHVSSSTYHTYHGTGGKWVVENGAIVGTQDKPGNGGVIMTDPQFGDFEVYLEMGNDFGPDSGLFLRSTEKGQAYQALIDYHKDGNVMGIYGEFIGNFLAVNYCFPTTTPDIIKIKEYPKFPCPFTPEQWKSIWRKDWNDLRARITGDPPTINTWINGIHTFQWTDTEKRTPPGPRGMIGLQNHGDPDHNTVGQFVRFRNVRVRELDTPDNSLSQLEKAAGWQLLFDGKTLNGWKTDKLQESKVPVEDSCIQPHGSGAYMMVNEQQFGDFILSLDFKISKGCNSGIFVRTSPLDVPAGYDVGFNGIEIAIDDTTTATMHDTGAIY
ncbi:MAG: DUF1080 domain-containing protein, partial [Phycisphaerae bacterium]|nr:DUF1080 domain-containing protein [Phycisphaerae bacterium]